MEKKLWRIRFTASNRLQKQNMAARVDGPTTSAFGSTWAQSRGGWHPARDTQGMGAAEMATIDDYLRRSQEADQLARLARDQNERDELLKIARIWHKLAQQRSGSRQGGDR